MIRDPFVAAAFKAAEDDGLAPGHVRIDRPRTLNGGAAEPVLEMVEWLNHDHRTTNVSARRPDSAPLPFERRWRGRWRHRYGAGPGRPQPRQRGWLTPYSA
jgi:hypothetical protein